MKSRRLEIGVMQGRLLRKFKGRYQAHPLNYWQEEFPIAADLGLDFIEFILDFNDVSENPLSSSEGVKRILSVVASSGVRVKSICADYFMEAPLHSSDPNIASKSLTQMKRLLQVAADLGATDVVLPCVDQSSIQTSSDMERLKVALFKVQQLSLEKKVNIALETDLGPADFQKLPCDLDSSAFTVNYDTGNSASLGFSPTEEVRAYGSRISDVHIKDRKLGGGSVELGTGDTNFGAFFSAFDPASFNGHFIMQAYRDEEGLGIFKKQLDWVKPKLESWIRGEGWT